MVIPQSKDAAVYGTVIFANDVLRAVLKLIARLTERLYRRPGRSQPFSRGSHKRFI